MSNSLIVLLIAFQLKHFVADFPLQNSYMLKKFSPGKEFILPLLAHTLVHATFTILIALYFVSLEKALLLGLLDLTIHFIMDRIKASPNMLGKYQALTKKDFLEYAEQIELNKDNESVVGQLTYGFDQDKADNKKFWWALGLDQGIHHLTHYLIIYLILG